MLRLYLWVTFGGALGSAARLGVSGLVAVEKDRGIHHRAMPRSGQAPPATLFRAAAQPSAPPPS